MSTLRELKGRIVSVASTGKTTNAMKMISSAKMHKAEQALKRLLPYRNMVQSVIGHLLATDGVFASPLIEEREVKRRAFVVLGSDDGLCGAYNINVFKQMLVILNDERSKNPDVDIDVYPIGKKIARAVRKIAGPHVNVVENSGLNTRSKVDEVSDFAEMLKKRFLAGEIDCVGLLYMHFHSMSRQRFQHDQLLPVSYEALKESCGNQNANSPCLFEPDANAIFNSVLPLHIMSVMQEVFTENVASENAARVMAMQTASDNAKKLLDELQLEYNKLRQEGITTELLDILGGQIER
ncbi:MAG: ATP synthase F1 subunit gamma [Muribaculaceae bacterium]|nr:ATP synthase F1 subunit gamma [Muribaculaceae bacterium]